MYAQFDTGSQEVQFLKCLKNIFKLGLVDFFFLLTLGQHEHIITFKLIWKFLLALLTMFLSPPTKGHIWLCFVDVFHGKQLPDANENNPVRVVRLNQKPVKFQARSQTKS